jgi:hypothetical protein
MELQTHLTRADILLARAAMALRPGFLFWLNCMIALAMPGYLSPELLTAGGISWFVFAVLVLLVFFFMTMLGIIVGAVELALARRGLQGVLGAHVLRLTDEGLVEETEFNRTVHSWQNVDRLIRFAGLTLVRAGSGWHLIPRRALSHNPNGKEFMRALEKHIAEIVR